jgi:GMP synthase (glutamine-hydrolysing)
LARKSDRRLSCVWSILLFYDKFSGMKVTVLQHVAPEGLASIQDALDAKQVSAEVVRIFDGDAAPRSLETDGLIVMGGPMGVYDPFPHLRDEQKLIESALSQGKPVLGVCLGSQLIASVLGATVKPSGRQEIGWHRVTIKDDPLWDGVPRSFEALHWHGDIFDLPLGAKSLASSKMTAQQAFQHGKALGLLFHLEVSESAIDGMADAFPEDLAKVGLTHSRLMEQSREHLPSLRSIGAAVFNRWVGWLGG